MGGVKSALGATNSMFQEVSGGTKMLEMVGQYQVASQLGTALGNTIGKAIGQTTDDKGNTAFGRWAKKMGVAKKAYGGGLQIWISDFNQSMERKYAYARAFAASLEAHGIDAFADSRMD